MLAPFEFFFKPKVEGVALLSLLFLSPSGYLVFVKVDYSFKLPFDLCFGQPCILIGLLVAGVSPAVVAVLPVKVPDEDFCKVHGASVDILESVDVVMGDKSTVESEKAVKLLIHPVDVSVFNDLFEVFNDGYCHGRVLRSVAFGLSFSGPFPCSL